MTKEEFINKWEDLIPEFYHVELAEDFDSVIAQSIAEHEAKQWKEYPKEKPEDEKDYLVQYEDSDCNEVGYFDSGKEWYTPSDGFYGEVIAFRELPAAYQEGGER